MGTLDNRYLSFTGNPFVDTGLIVALCKGKELGLDTEEITKVSLDDFAKIIGDGAWVAEANRKLNAFTMVVGVNSLLTNPSMNPSLSKKKPKKASAKDDDGLKAYVKVLKELAKGDSLSEEFCEICGTRHATTLLEKEGKSIGRDWFPLAGSLGNDAQALPAASRAPRICSVCLLAVQMLPQGVMLMKRKLACFQSTQFLVPRLIVESIYEDTKSRIHTIGSDSKVPAVGSKNSKTPAEVLIQVFRDLRSHRRRNNLPANTALYVWLFSNSGTTPECEIIEVPNSTLSFLYEAEKNYSNEVLALIRNDKTKKFEYQFFNCIRTGKDYYGLYPSSKNEIIVSKELFNLYQTKICRWDSPALEIAERLAFLISQNTESKSLKQIKKYVCDHKKEKIKQIRPQLKRKFVEFAETGQFTLEEYCCLFPQTSLTPLQSDTRGFKLIGFYLNNPNMSQIRHVDLVGSTVNSPLKTFSKNLFSFYHTKRGLGYIKNILDKFKRRKITISDLERWMTNPEVVLNNSETELAKLYVDQDGNINPWEFMFQIRLGLANLYWQEKNGGK